MERLQGRLIMERLIVAIVFWTSLSILTPWGIFDWETWAVVLLVLVRDAVLRLLNEEEQAKNRHRLWRGSE